MSTKSQRVVRARQRLARGRQELRKADAALARERRRLDTRRKVLAGSVLLDVLIPKGNDRLRHIVGDALGRAIVNNRRKSASVRREELDLFRDDLGDDWGRRWSAKLGDDEDA